MVTFLIGLSILIIGGFFYSKVCEKTFGADGRQTPAYAKEDGVDFVPMRTWKNALINLLDIAGTGPIFGAIQGILFGPVVFIIIPIGNIIGGAMHDYFSGMISVRDGGEQMPSLIKKYTNKPVFGLYNIMICALLLLVGVVFIYTPGDMITTALLHRSGAVSDVWTWVVYGCIFLYYFAATLFPIDKIIGKIYPIFGVLLVFSAIGLFIGLFVKNYGCSLNELSIANWKGIYPVDGVHLIPIFFLTVACGIVSGFHSTQCTLIGRSMKSEYNGKYVFYYMMVAEGFIAMVWAAAAMAAYNLGLADMIKTTPVSMVEIVCKSLLGNIGGIIAILGVIVLPITSGDTSLRGLRLMIAEQFNIEQKSPIKRLAITGSLLSVVAVILVYSKLAANGFTVLWRYFAWANQTVAVFAFAMITIFLIQHKKFYPMALIPGMFYVYVTTSYIINAKIGFNVPYHLSLILGAVISIIYAYFTVAAGKHKKEIIV